MSLVAERGLFKHGASLFCERLVMYPNFMKAIVYRLNLGCFHIYD